MDFGIRGLLEVTDGAVAVEVRGGKLRAVLAMLVLQANQVVSADRLAAGLWGDSLPPSRTNTLQGYVSQLRKLLGAGLIQTRASGYALVVEPHRVDAFRFERLLDEGRAAMVHGELDHAARLLADAQATWRGAPLADFVFEGFAQPHIARLEELRLVAIALAVEVDLERGRHAELVAPLRSLVDQHPLREQLWIQLITALYRSGRQAEALRAYDEVRRRLAEDLGIAPGAALKALEEAVLQQRPELDWAPLASPAPTPPRVTPQNLPSSRSSFIGRARELSEVKKLLHAETLVSVVGPGGAGKTRLALEVAHQVLDRFPGGVWVVELAAIDDPAEVPDAVAAVDGGGGFGRRLLVLDNCEHVVAGAAAVAESLLDGADDVVVLATSRQPLRIEGETVWRIPAMALPPPETTLAEDPRDFESVQLFVERATDAGAIGLTPEVLQAVAALCRRLDGNPLAIELAAARGRALTPHQLLERIHDRFGVLTGGTRLIPRHQTLRAAIEWSHNQLTDPERILLRRLAVFEGDFTLEMAEAVCSDDLLLLDEVAPVLASLVERSLVLADVSRGQGSYALPENHRAYALERLAGTQEGDRFTARRLAGDDGVVRVRNAG